jgi:hypothetical protein
LALRVRHHEGNAGNDTADHSHDGPPAETAGLPSFPLGDGSSLPAGGQEVALSRRQFVMMVGSPAFGFI